MQCRTFAETEAPRSPFNRNEMKIVVIGAGLAGVTTAYSLAGLGHEVTVLDRAAAPAREASFANGGMLTVGMCAPWNAPGVWRVLLKSLCRSDTALQLRLGALPGLVSWGNRFLRNSTPAAFLRNHRKNLRLAQYSLELMKALRRDTGIEYGRAARGSLSLFRSEQALHRAADHAGRLSDAGLAFRVLSPAETVGLEPALAPLAARLSGSIHYPDDETGDAREFCVRLAGRARDRGAKFLFSTAITRVEVQGAGVAAVSEAGKRIVADRCVVAAGAYSSVLLGTARVKLPVRPAKGYSVTFDHLPQQPVLNRPVIDNHLHAVIVPFEGALRAAGTAEFAGYDKTLRPARVRNLLALMKEILPQGNWDPRRARPWCGLRPSSPDGVAIVGPTPIPNLWVNCGQGHLGWTLAAGSAQLLTDLISGRRPGVDPVDYSLGRF